MTQPAPNVFGLQIGWGAIFGFVNLILGGGVLGAWIKNRPKMREVTLTAEEKLRDDLIARVTKLEADVQIRERERDNERARHEAELRMMRHRLNNSDQGIEALLLILDDDDLPDRLKIKVQRIRDLRARQKDAEERERDTITAAALLAKVAPPAI